MNDNILISLSFIFLGINVKSNEINGLMFKSDRLLAPQMVAGGQARRPRADDEHALAAFDARLVERPSLAMAWSPRKRSTELMPDRLRRSRPGCTPFRTGGAGRDPSPRAGDCLAVSACQAASYSPASAWESQPWMSSRPDRPRCRAAAGRHRSACCVRHEPVWFSLLVPTSSAMAKGCSCCPHPALRATLSRKAGFAFSRTAERA